MKSIIIDLTVENCHEALLYYKEIFGGEIKNTQLADGIDMFKGHEGKYIHSELHINENCILYLTDIFSENHIPGNNFKIVLQLNSNEEIEKQYDALTRNGQIVFPLQDTFWGSRHGSRYRIKIGRYLGTRIIKNKGNRLRGKTKWFFI